jgi:hypothetical protein
VSTLRNRLSFMFGLVGVLALALSISGAAIAAGGRGAPTPDGFDAYLVYMADGRYDPSVMGPDGDYFQKDIMGRSDAEIAQNRADAIAFFIERFGIDPDSAEFEDDVMFGSFTFDPRNEYRAYTISGESVPSSGWVVRDGGWSLAITNPDGLTLGGEFAGTEVPAGTMMVFGEYNIERLGPGNSGKNSAHAEPLIIQYQSGGPIVPNADGSIMFQCELFSDDFGHGLAQGISAPQMMADGTVQANVRNVLTFPGFGN